MTGSAAAAWLLQEGACSGEERIMKNLDFGRGAQPLYMQLKEIIRQDIENGVYARHETIPAEIVFQNQYGVSRITVRQAISSLEQEGYVERSRGRGTQVIWRKGIEEDVNQLISLTAEFEQQGHAIDTPFVQVVREVPPVEVQAAFESGKECLRIDRIRTADGEPIVFFRTWIPCGLGFPEDRDAYSGSLYGLYEQITGSQPALSHDELYSDLASGQVAEKLGIPEGSPLLVRQRTGYDLRNDPVEYTISYFRGDRYRYRIDLSSRQSH